MKACGVGDVCCSNGKRLKFVFVKCKIQLETIRPNVIHSTRKENNIKSTHTHTHPSRAHMRLFILSNDNNNNFDRATDVNLITFDLISNLDVYIRKVRIEIIYIVCTNRISFLCCAPPRSMNEYGQSSGGVSMMGRYNNNNSNNK